MTTRKIFFCDRIRKEMYKALNLKDKNSYVVFVVKNAYLLYFPLSFKSS